MDVRRALLRAAMQVFAETGTRGATTRRIAQAAGVNEVTLFRHFRSKDELLHEAFQVFAREATAPTLPATPVDPRAELIAWCRSRHRSLHKVRALIRRSMAEFTEYPDNCQAGMQASVRMADELASYLARLRRLGLASGAWHERVATAMLMGALFADAMGRDAMPARYPLGVRDSIERYVDLLLEAIHATPVTPTIRALGGHAV
jgi:AcrR family transcriptional regulator